jgi:translation elongation factor EF-Tu-like GTPase
MKVRADIQLIATAHGGRREPLRGSFRPNHRFAGKDDFAVGEVEQEADALLAPGESAELIVTFMPDGLPMLTRGMRWDLREGPDRLIGHGRILDILEP